MIQFWALRYIKSEGRESSALKCCKLSGKSFLKMSYREVVSWDKGTWLMWIDNPEKYLSLLLLPKWMWSPEATLAAVFMTSAGPEFRCPFLGLPAGLELGVQKMHAQWKFRGCWKTPFLEHLVNMHEGGLFMITKWLLEGLLSERIVV